jgi:hypothetical protein
MVLSVIQGVALNIGVLPLSKGRALHSIFFVELVIRVLFLYPCGTLCILIHVVKIEMN